MDTPKRFKGSDDDFLATTPFRERALREQRLKEELLSSATPGWRRRRSPEKQTADISKDHNEVKEYLRDLSSVLASQGRNLTSFLAEEASTKSDETDIRIKSSPKELTPPKPQHSVAESVLSQLYSDVRKPKVRKIDGLVIRDVERESLQEDDLLGRQSSLPEPVGSPSFMVESVPIEDEDPQNEPPVENGPDPSQMVSVPGGSPEDLGSPQSFESDEDSIETEPETVDLLSVSRLKQSLSQFLSENDIKLGQGSWRALQDASVTMVERLSNYFNEEDHKLVIDRQNILKMLERFEIVPLKATNDDIFEMCCKYLPLEELNELEMGLFL